MGMCQEAQGHGALGVLVISRRQITLGAIQLTLGCGFQEGQRNNRLDAIFLIFIKDTIKLYIAHQLLASVDS